ncbi:MAG TPA: hypothetical protein VH157_13420 [Bryobacteraceae bacterium]|nr:hypothetical protein [Bryobacteraceae bacterium]
MLAPNWERGYDLHRSVRPSPEKQSAYFKTTVREVAQAFNGFVADRFEYVAWTRDFGIQRRVSPLQDVRNGEYLMRCSHAIRFSVSDRTKRRSTI